MFRAAAVATVLSLLSVAPAAAADGAQLFNMQCKMCHGGSVMGPTLSGVAGGAIAAKPGFAYSPALKAKGGTWTDANLDAYLKAPGGFAPGTRMLISVPAEANRAALIGYMKTLK